jgi:NAD(P)-dependent dehydrogenase (short-subunit alcohol dehydrogenase family)
MKGGTILPRSTACLSYDTFNLRNVTTQELARRVFDAVERGHLLVLRAYTNASANARPDAVRVLVRQVMADRRDVSFDGRTYRIEVVAVIKQSGRKAVAIPGDLRDEGFCQKLVTQAVHDLGGLDILVSNAGKQHAVERIEDLTTEQFDATYKTNVYAMFWLCKAALAHMPAGGAIINTASVEAYSPEPHLLDYASTKAAIVTFTKALAKQVAKRGVRVNAVAPGPYWTPLQVTGGQFPEKIVNFGQTTPLGRPGQPVEIAPVYVLLASAEATDITGQVFGASGGRGEP